MQEWKGDKGGSGRKTAVKAAVKELRRERQEVQMRCVPEFRNFCGENVIKLF